MRALGDSKRPLYFLLVASVLNIGLDLACISPLLNSTPLAFVVSHARSVVNCGYSLSLIHI